MLRNSLIHAIGAAGFVALWSGAAHADQDQFSARLSGFQEVGALTSETGAILTDGAGTLQFYLDKKSMMASYKLTFSNLTSAATMAHIHFGKTHVPGGIMVWLCQTMAKPSPVAGTPLCPAAGGSVSGMITSASVIAITGQNVPAMSFAALEDALISDTAYANVHTVNFPAGEIRGQVHLSDKNDK